MRSRTFLNVSLGILALAVAYDFGASSAHSQAGGQSVGMTTGSGSGVILALTDAGDVYSAADGCLGQSSQFRANVLSGPTPAQRTSFGELKSRYRGEREPATGR